jgi:hypothetical protein
MRWSSKMRWTGKTANILRNEIDESPRERWQPAGFESRKIRKLELNT